MFPEDFPTPLAEKRQQGLNLEIGIYKACTLPIGDPWTPHGTSTSTAKQTHRKQRGKEPLTHLPHVVDMRYPRAGRAGESSSGSSWRVFGQGGCFSAVQSSLEDPE